MVRSRNSQVGLSFFGWFLVLIAIGTVASVVVRLTPHYLEFRTIATVVEGLARDQDITKMSKSRIVQALRKRLEINSIRGFDYRNHLKLTRKREMTVITVAYEVREHLFGNVDVVLNFERSFERKTG
jgi:hypothetical protein